MPQQHDVAAQAVVATHAAAAVAQTRPPDDVEDEPLAAERDVLPTGIEVVGMRGADHLVLRFGAGEDEVVVPAADFPVQLAEAKGMQAAARAARATRR
jgi:hypothetical protein